MSPARPPAVPERTQRAPLAWAQRTTRALIGCVAVLCALTIALLAVPVLAAPTDSQPTLTVTLEANKSSATESDYQAVAAGFTPQTQLTITLGDGSGIAPLQGKTDSTGGYTSWWVLSVAPKYCATLTATDGTNTATASFWVAVATDSQSGTTCAAATSSGPTATPVASAAPTQTSATPVPTKAAPPPPPVTSPPSSGSSLGTRVQHVIARIPGGWATVIGGSILAILVLVGLIALGMLNKNRASDMRASQRRMPVAGRGMAASGMPSRRTPAVGQTTTGRHPYDRPNNDGDQFNGNGAPGGTGAVWSNSAMRASPRAGFTGQRANAPVRTPPPWVGEPGATPGVTSGRTSSYRMPTNRSARRAIPPNAAGQRWDRSRPDARMRRDDPPAYRDDDWPPNPDY